MANRRAKRRPASTVEGREAQLISLATDLVEKQLADGTASSQVISHFLKMGSTREKLEKEKLRRENDLLKAKVESLESGKHIQQLYDEAIDAMRRYSGHGDEVEAENAD